VTARTDAGTVLSAMRMNGYLGASFAYVVCAV
jgi:hypothetical protein